MFFVLLVILLVTLCLHHFKIRYSRHGRLIDKLPGPFAYPIFGNIFEWMLLDSRTMFAKIREDHTKYERFNRNWMLGTPIIALYNPDDAEALLSQSKYNDKSEFYIFLSPWLGDGLLLSKGSKWHQRRKVLTPSFHFDILKSFCRTFAEESGLLVEKLKDVCGQEVSISNYIGRSVLNALCETTMGINSVETGQTNEVYRNAVNESSKQIIYRALRPYLFAPLIYFNTKAGQQHKETLKILHDFTLNVIRKKRSQKSFDKDIMEYRDGQNDDVFLSNKKKRLAMLDLLLHSEKNGEIDEAGIQEEVDTFMFEGHDTVSAGLNFTLMLIANYQDVQAKIYNELIDVFGETPISEVTMEQLQKLKYLECVVKESLRLYPSVPAISRRIHDDLVLNGYTIPAESVCEVHLYDMHRDSKLFPDPERFDPDRFLPENSTNRHPFAYIPFSAGPRNCIGQRYAMLEAKSIIASILRHFYLIAVTKPEDMEIYSDLVLRTKEPIKIIFNQR